MSTKRAKPSERTVPSLHDRVKTALKLPDTCVVGDTCVTLVAIRHKYNKPAKPDDYLVENMRLRTLLDEMTRAVLACGTDRIVAVRLDMGADGDWFSGELDVEVQAAPPPKRRKKSNR